MVKKLLLCVVLAGFLLTAIPAVAEDNMSNWFALGTGGVFTSYDELTNGQVWGTAQFKFCRLIYKDLIGIRGSYQDLNSGTEWNDFGGEVIFFTRNPKTHKFQAYIFTGTGLASNPAKNDIVNSSFAGGLGLIIPIGGIDWLIEGSAKMIDNKWVGMTTAGIQVQLEF